MTDPAVHATLREVHAAGRAIGLADALRAARPVPPGPDQAARILSSLEKLERGAYQSSAARYDVTALQDERRLRQAVASGAISAEEVAR